MFHMLFALAGNGAKSTVCLNNNSNQNNGQVVSRVTPSISLLIESLIQQLCMLFEGDNLVRRNKLYFGNIFIFLIKIKATVYLIVLGATLCLYNFKIKYSNYRMDMLIFCLPIIVS